MHILGQGPSGPGRRWLVIAAALVVLLGGGVWAVLAISDSTGSGSQTPSPLAVDLAGWKLTIPEEGDGGDAATIEPAALKEPWLTVAPDGGLMFWAPASGATTKNSDHPRTELQSLDNFAAGSGTRTLSASVTLLQVPQDGRGIILGQIHGAEDIRAAPYVMLRLEDDSLRVVVKEAPKGDRDVNYPLLDSVGLNSRIDFTISDLGNGSMAFSATQNGVTRQASAPIPEQFRGQTVRFQAGAYQLAEDPDGDQDGGRVVFHRLTQK